MCIVSHLYDVSVPTINDFARDNGLMAHVAADEMSWYFPGWATPVAYTRRNVDVTWPWGNPLPCRHVRRAGEASAWRHGVSRRIRLMSAGERQGAEVACPLRKAATDFRPCPTWLCRLCPQRISRLPARLSRYRTSQHARYSRTCAGTGYRTSFRSPRPFLSVTWERETGTALPNSIHCTSQAVKKNPK